MKRILLLVAAVLLALPFGASVAMAGPGGNSNDVSDDTGNACPEASPQGAEEDPSCGNEGDNGKSGEANADKGNNGKSGNNAEDGNDGETGEACPPASPNAGGDPACGDGDDDDAEEPCAEGEVRDPETGECAADDGGEEPCAEGEIRDENGDCVVDGGDTGGDAAGVCTEAAGDAGLVGDPIGKQLYDGGLSEASPLVEDPQADGAITGEIYTGGKDTPLEPVTNEVACTGDTLIDPASGLPDL